MKSDPVAPPVPALLDGGGPAGVVDPNENPVLGLLAGVAFACADDALELALPNKPPPPVLPAVLNRPELCPAPDVSAVLLGVEKPANAEEPAFEALLVGLEAPLNSLEVDSPPPPKMLPPPLACWPPPNCEGFCCVFDSNDGFVGAVLVLLPKRFELEVEGGLLLVPKKPLLGGFEVLENA